MAAFKYLARKYTQHQDASSSIVTFVAPATEIVEWAGVPRKASELSEKQGTLTGFQRALDQNRVEEIKEFFEEPANLSPTSVVVAFREQQVRVTEISPQLGDLVEDEMRGEWVWLEIEIEELDDLSTADLLDMFLEHVEQRVPEDGSEWLSENEPDEADSEEDEEGFVLHDSHLNRFIKQMRTIRASIEDQGLPQNLSETELRETLISMLLPAMLVDGQHRVYGALQHDEETPFCVCALLDTTWEEQVFQFVVINEKSAGIDQAFLSAIVSTSLTQNEIDMIRPRLESAGVDIAQSEIMEQLHHDGRSPFQGMIKFSVPGETGQLPFSGLKRLVKKFWHLKNPEFDLLVSHLCNGETNKEKLADWKDEKWFDYFCAFWWVIRRKYEGGDDGEIDLWNDVQESQLMMVETLNTLQDSFIEWSSYAKRQFPENIEEFKQLVSTWIDSVPKEFFLEEWKGVTSLPKDGKEKLRYALKERIRNPKFVYRNSKLFKE